jgi:hypothetical protein
VLCLVLCCVLCRRANRYLPDEQIGKLPSRHGAANTFHTEWIEAKEDGSHMDGKIESFDQL